MALFLFGMNLMSDHLNKIAGSKAEILLSKLTNKPLKGAVMGAAVTSLIQSSSASCAMTISLVESNILQLNSAIAIIIGSILGTSATGWIIAYSSVRFGNNFAMLFSPYVISAFFAIVGIVFKVFIHQKRIKRIGEIFLGFSILMLGINTISEAVAPLKESVGINNTISSVDNVFILFLIGILIAAVLQSASASVGILQSISVIGILNMHLIVPMLLGIGIGASLPIVLAATGKNNNAKRCAFSYVFVDTLGALIIGSTYYAIINLFNISELSIAINSVTIAAMNTIYRLIIFIMFIPFTGLIEIISKKAIKTKKQKRKEMVTVENE